MIKRIKRWYNGTSIVEIWDQDNDEDAHVYFAPSVRIDYHWTARAARRAVKFYEDHWQFVWGTAISAGSLIAAVVALK